MADKQLLFSEVGGSIFEPVEIEVLGESGASGTGMKARGNMETGVKVDSDGLTEASEQQRDKKPLHGVEWSLLVSTASGVQYRVDILWFCLVLWRISQVAAHFGVTRQRRESDRFICNEQKFTRAMYRSGYERGVGYPTNERGRLVIQIAEHVACHQVFTLIQSEVN